jgi:hypothetical protein
MLRREEVVPQQVCSLADHLDTVLAATEDLLELHPENVHADGLVRLELIAISHALQARQRLAELHFDEPLLADQSQCFIAGTDALEVGEAQNVEPLVEHAPLSEDYCVGRRISIRRLIELASGVLDSLERFYVLYPEQHDEVELMSHPRAGLAVRASSDSAPNPTTVG